MAVRMRERARPAAVVETVTGKKITAGHAEWLPLHLLHLGPDNPYQRPVLESFVQEKIVDNFNPKKVGVPEVYPRADGSYWVGDGGNRVTGVKRIYSPDDLLLCHVVPTESIKEEADVVLDINQTRRAWSAFAKFRAGKVKEDPAVLGLIQLCDELGITISDSQKAKMPKLLQATGTALKLYRRKGGPVLLARALKALVEIWPNAADALDHNILEGMVYFMAKHGLDIDDDTLRRKLVASSPELLIQEAHQLQRTAKWRLASYVAMAIEGTYNLQLRDARRLRETLASAYSNSLRDYERRQRVIEHRRQTRKQ